jgi:prepilin signal peptidase PulO-like enzyme (type II secretory pathway)
MLSLPYQLALVAAWTIGAALVDRHDARTAGVSAVAPWQSMLVGIAALAATAIGPQGLAFPLGLAIAGLGVAACGDLRHRFMWQRIAVPTFVAVLAARYLAHAFVPALLSALLMGALALVAYAAGQRFGRGAGMGFGDIVPIATVGAALGFVTAPFAMCLASLLFVIVALARKHGRGTALPFGPAIVTALLIGLLFR